MSGIHVNKLVADRDKMLRNITEERTVNFLRYTGDVLAKRDMEYDKPPYPPILYMHGQLAIHSIDPSLEIEQYQVFGRRTTHPHTCAQDVQPRSWCCAPFSLALAQAKREPSKHLASSFR